MSFDPKEEEERKAQLALAIAEKEERLRKAKMYEIEQTKRMEALFASIDTSDKRMIHMSADAQELWGILWKVIRNEPYSLDQPNRYSELTSEGLDYDWEHIYDDFKEIIDRNPECVVETRTDGSNIFHMLAEHSDLMDARLLVKCIETKPEGLQKQNNFGLLPLHKAVMYKADIEELIVILEAFPQGLAVQNIEGQTPLHLAVTGTKAHIHTITFILSDEKYGLPTVKVIDKYGHLPLHKCVSRGNVDPQVFYELIDAYPQAARKFDKKNRLPLHWACSRINPSIFVVKRLILLYPEGVQARDDEDMNCLERWLMMDPRANEHKMLEEITPPRMQDREELMYMLMHTDEFVENERIKEAEDDARREAELEHLDTDEILNF